MGKRKIAVTEADERVIQWLYHPSPMGTLRLHTKEATYQRLNKLTAAGLIFIVGYIATKGRNRAVYANSRSWKADTIRHEVILSRILLDWGYACVRGKDVDQKLLPDATILDGLHVELDTGSMNHGRVESRLRNYIDSLDPVIVITANPKRKREILRRCDFLQDGLLVCTVSEALAPEVVLEDCNRGHWALEEALRKGLRKPGVSSGTKETKTKEDNVLRQGGQSD